MASLELTLPSPVNAPAWLDSATTEQDVSAALNSTAHRERWKYTKAAPVLDLVSQVAGEPNFATLPDGVNITRIDNAQSGSTDSALGSSSTWDAITVPEAFAAICYQPALYVVDIVGKLDEPLELNHQGSTLPLLIRLAPDASADLRETFSDDPAQQQTIWIELGLNSRLQHSRNSFFPQEHWQALQVTLQAHAQYALHNHTTGARLRRQDTHINVVGEGAHAEIQAAAYIGEGMHLDQHVSIEHSTPHATSNQVFHNIAGNKAKVTFNGRIHIHANANGVSAELSNKNLCLDNTATINTKPELEIYTDDVKCAHGATVGQVDPDHLFYCASRGIGEAKARQLLSQAFLTSCTGGPLAQTAQEVFQEALA